MVAKSCCSVFAMLLFRVFFRSTLSEAGVGRGKVVQVVKM